MRLTRAGRWQVVEIAGEMDLQVDPFLDGVGADPCFVVFDLRAVTFMDCSSLRALENVQRRARAAGGSMRLAAVSTQVLRILALTRMDRAFPLFETVQAATSLAVTADRDAVPRPPGRGISRLRRRPRGAMRTEQLRGALLRRMTIEHATGALARIHGISPDDAFTMMRVYCLSHRHHLIEIATLVVEDPRAVPELTGWIKQRP
ncbi:MAG TPA: STAS domain-containing protein [Nocardioides sp.]|nr:STAS domain-containing protein [Nocardioides sp.]